MGRKSTVKLLPPEIRTAVDDAIRDGRATIQQIVATIRDMGGQASYGAVQRYRVEFSEALTNYKEAQEVAGVWTRQLAENPQGDVGRLVQEMLKSLAFQTLAGMGRTGEAIGPEDIMLLAKAFKDLESAQKTNAEFRAKVKAELVRELAEKQAAAAAVVAAEERAGGLSKDAGARIRAAVLGIVQ